MTRQQRRALLRVKVQQEFTSQESLMRRWGPKRQWHTRTKRRACIRYFAKWILRGDTLGLPDYNPEVFDFLAKG